MKYYKVVGIEYAMTGKARFSYYIKDLNDLGLVFKKFLEDYYKGTEYVGYEVCESKYGFNKCSYELMYKFNGYFGGIFQADPHLLIYEVDEKEYVENKLLK